MTLNEFKEKLDTYIENIQDEFDESEDKNIYRTIDTSLLRTLRDAYEKNGHYFKVDTNTLGIFLSTKPSVSKKGIRLPFSSIFMDTKLPFENKIIDGMLFTQHTICDLDDQYLEEYYELMNEEAKVGDFDKLSKEEKVELREDNIYASDISVMLYVKDGDNYSFQTLYYVYINDGNILLEKSYSEHNFDKKEINHITNFLKNFCLFCNDPRVTNVSKKLTYSSLLKRKKRNQPVSPYLLQSVVNEELRRYISENKPYFYDIVKNIKDFLSNKKKVKKLGYSYWVKAHYRKLRSDRYTNKKGQLIWIAPFKKGSGLERKQEFILKSKPRKRPINEGAKNDD